VEDWVGRLPAAQSVVANPPRAGLDGSVIAGLRRPGPARLVYVSCDPATLARDLALLCRPGPEVEGRPYRLSVVQPFDLFPQTAHVEVVVALER
jgi:23S rRNA (uracil1939-C5)-methyltransferase